MALGQVAPTAPATDRPSSAPPYPLSQALDDAAANTDAAELVAKRIERTAIAEEQAFGDVVPSLTLSAALTRNQEEVVLGDRVFVNLWDYGADATLAIDLFRGASFAAWRASTKQVEVAQTQARYERAALRLAAGRAYLAALTARKNLLAAQDTVRLREHSSQRAEALLEGGYGLPVDTSQAKLAVNEAQTAVLDAELTLMDALDALAFLTGKPAVDPASLRAPNIPSATALSAGEANDRLTQRADIEVYEKSIEVSEVRSLGRWLDLAPWITMAAQYQFGPESIRAPNGVSWAVTLRATWVLLDYGAWANIDAETVVREELTLERAQAIEQAERNQASAVRRVQAADARVVLAEETLATATELRELVAIQYEGGDVTTLELTEADGALFRAQVGANLAELERDLARLELAWLEGRLETGESRW